MFVVLKKEIMMNILDQHQFYIFPKRMKEFWVVIKTEFIRFSKKILRYAQNDNPSRVYTQSRTQESNIILGIPTFAGITFFNTLLKIFVILIILSSAGCYRVGTDVWIKRKHLPANINQPVYVYSLNEQLPDSSEEIGNLKTMPGQMFLYPDIYKAAIEETRKMGGNAIKIIDIVKSKRTQAGWRIYAKVYKLNKLETYKFNQDSLEKQWLTHKKEMFEGKYETVVGEDSISSTYYRIHQPDGSYILVYSDSERNLFSPEWHLFDIKAKLKPTPNPDIFKAYWYNRNKSVEENVYVKFQNGSFRAIFGDREEKFEQLFPEITKSKLQIHSGTCFAIGEKGYLATSYKNIQKSAKFYIRGINGNFTKKYPAKLIANDEDNDLALIKLRDSSVFLPVLKYNITETDNITGDEVYILGFPMIEFMGEEPKLMKGIISSKSGYLGDRRLYHISSVYADGMAGSPVFDNSGNLIGIVRSKLFATENTTYAVKASYIKILLEKNKINTVAKYNNAPKVLHEYIEGLKGSVYIIESEYEEETIE
ncbi:MAG: hypothetical protein HW421_738 [Ignavibacteria bacterium]|nr:hypothetical protein [Ignavibacteria bacterium]